MKKRLISYLLFSTAISVLPVSDSYAQTAVVSFEKADVNGDNHVDISDVVAVINFIAYGGNNEDPGGNDEDPNGKNDAAVEAGLCPGSKHPHVIDMGDAGKWACCNVGASAPWEKGGLYAWGETEEKDSYKWSNYTHCDGSEETCHDLGSDISGTQYDVAHVKWGGKWRMPSNDQIKLLDNYSSECTELNGVNGRKITASNGNSIFLPFTNSYRDYSGDYSFTGEVVFDGYIWASTQWANPACADRFGFASYGYTFYDWHYRYLGNSVRPVTE